MLRLLESLRYRKNLLVAILLIKLLALQCTRISYPKIREIKSILSSLKKFDFLLQNGFIFCCNFFFFRYSNLTLSNKFEWVEGGKLIWSKMSLIWHLQRLASFLCLEKCFFIWLELILASYQVLRNACSLVLHCNWIWQVLSLQVMTHL